MRRRVLHESFSERGSGFALVIFIYPVIRWKQDLVLFCIARTRAASWWWRYFFMTDFEVLQAYAKGRDAEAFRTMVEMYQGVVYGAARRVLGDSGEVEDVVQMTFLKLAEAAGKIRENLGGWLYATAVNGARDVLRREGTRKRHEMAGRIREGNSLETWAEVSVVVDEEILGLPSELREMVVGHFLSGESQRAMAERMGVSQPTVGRRIAEAVDMYAQAIEAGLWWGWGGACRWDWRGSRRWWCR